MTFVTYRCRNCGTVGSFYDDEAGNLWCRRCGDQLEDIEDADKEETDAPKKRNLVQVVSGKWYAIASGGKPYEEQCCDCGLVHDIQYKVENGRIWQRWDVNEKKSRLARKTSSQRYVPK